MGLGSEGKGLIVRHARVESCIVSRFGDMRHGCWAEKCRYSWVGSDHLIDGRKGGRQCRHDVCARTRYHVLANNASSTTAYNSKVIWPEQLEINTGSRARRFVSATLT